MAVRYVRPCLQLILPVGRQDMDRPDAASYRLGNVCAESERVDCDVAHLIEEIFGEPDWSNASGADCGQSLSISGSATRAYFSPLSVMATHADAVRHGRYEAVAPQREDGEEKPVTEPGPFRSGRGGGATLFSHPKLK